MSTLFVVWSVTAFAAEVPSGALADLLPRRLVLAASSVLTAAGFALWLLAPTFAGFAAGFVAWGIGGALLSGTWQSLLYDELAARRATHRYAGIIGLGESAGWIASVLAAAVVPPLLHLGGYAAVTVASIVVMLLHAALTLALPDPPRTGIDPEELDEDDASEAPDRTSTPDEADEAEEADQADQATTLGGAVGEYLATIRAGVHEAVRHPRVARIVLTLSVLTGLLAFDEYFPLVAAGTGVATDTVPLLMVLAFAGPAIGAAAAGPAARLHPRWPPRLLALAVVVMAAGALSRHPVGFVAVVVGYATAICVKVLAEAQLQDRITGAARATVTSTVGLGSELVAVALFAAYAGGSAVAPVGVLVAVNALALLVPTVRLRRAVRT